MNFRQKITSGFIGLSLFLTPGLKAGVEEDHKKLWNALESVGVELHLNHPEYCDARQGISGLYSASHNIMIICQDGRIPISSREVDWTANDYDTLRHEAHHVVQDCVAGLENEKMDVFFSDNDSFSQFISTTLTEELFDAIVKEYRNNGNSDEVVIQELEAFAVASAISPESIAKTLVKICT